MMDAPVEAATATAYAARQAGGRSTAGPTEVWLRGNIRPVLGIGATVLGGLALAVGFAAAAGAGTAVVGPLAAATAVAAVAVAVLVRAARGPRLGRRGDALVLRLSPWRTDEVPLGVVECVFPGSQPVAGPVLQGQPAHDEAATAGPPATRRVGTLVIRFAERAGEWRSRPTFAAWGTWHDGHVVLDGRWCEPLSAEVARTIGQRLLQAKREAATGGQIR